MQSLPSLKRGDTFSFIASLKDANGSALTGIAAQLKSQIRNKSDVLYSNLTITETATAGNAGSSKPVVATGIITKSKSISITLTAETDRAYIN